VNGGPPSNLLRLEDYLVLSAGSHEALTKKQSQGLESKQLVPNFDRRSLFSLLKEIQMMMTNGGTNSTSKEEDEDRIRSFFGTISKRYTWRILSYLFENGAITSVIANRRLSVPRRSAFRNLSELEEMGILELATRAKVPNRDGKPGNVYRLIGADVEDVRKAVRLHNLLIGSRKYRIADDLAQTILEEFNEKGLKEIRYRDILVQVKALKIPFSSPDIADMTASYLHEQGIVVWR